MPTPSRRSLAVALATAVLLLGACGGDDQESGSDVIADTTETTATTETTEMTDSTEGPTTTAGATATTKAPASKTKFTIVAKNIKFDPDKLTIPVATEVEITLDNRDNAVPHNIHFKTPTEVKSDLKEGKSSGVKDRMKLKVDQAGTYEFLCDVHPTMKGELTVA